MWVSDRRCQSTKHHEGSHSDFLQGKQQATSPKTLHQQKLTYPELPPPAKWGRETLQKNNNDERGDEMGKDPGSTSPR